MSPQKTLHARGSSESEGSYEKIAPTFVESVCNFVATSLFLGKLEHRMRILFSQQKCSSGRGWGIVPYSLDPNMLHCDIFVETTI